MADDEDSKDPNPDASAAEQGRRPSNAEIQEATDAIRRDLVVRSYCRNADLDDLVQKVLLEGSRKYKGIRGATFVTYALAIARYRAKDLAKRQKREVLTDDGEMGRPDVEGLPVEETPSREIPNPSAQLASDFERFLENEATAVCSLLWGPKNARGPGEVAKFLRLRLEAFCKAGTGTPDTRQPPVRLHLSDSGKPLYYVRACEPLGPSLRDTERGMIPLRIPSDFESKLMDFVKTVAHTVENKPRETGEGQWVENADSRPAPRRGPPRVTRQTWFDHRRDMGKAIVRKALALAGLTAKEINILGARARRAAATKRKRRTS